MTSSYLREYRWHRCVTNSGCWETRNLHKSEFVITDESLVTAKSVITTKSVTAKSPSCVSRSYAEVGLRRLGLEPAVSSDQLERAQMKLTRWREVVAFFTLRLCVLPVVETVVLLDRMLFLAQNGRCQILYV